MVTGADVGTKTLSKTPGLFLMYVIWIIVHLYYEVEVCIPSKTRQRSVTLVQFELEQGV